MVGAPTCGQGASPGAWPARGARCAAWRVRARALGSGHVRAAAPGARTQQAVPDTARRALPRGWRGARGRRHRSRSRRWRGARPRRRIGLRQDHRGALHPAVGRADCGLREGARAGRVGDARARAARLPPPHADDLPGSLWQPEPAHDRPSDPRGAAGGPPLGGRERGRSARGGAARARGARQGPARRLPPPVLRGTAAAHRHRARPRARAAPHRVRRAGLGPRRLGAGAGAQSPVRPPARARHRLPLHFA